MGAGIFAEKSNFYTFEIRTSELVAKWERYSSRPPKLRRIRVGCVRLARFCCRLSLFAFVAALAITELSSSPLMAQESAPAAETPPDAGAKLSLTNLPGLGSPGKVADAALPKSGDTFQDGASYLDSLNLPGVFAQNSWVEWGILLLAIFVGLLCGKITQWVLGRIAQRLSRKGSRIRAQIPKDLVGPAKLVFLTIGLAVGLANIKGMSDPLQTFWAKTLLLLYTIAFFWYAFNLIGIVDIWLRRAMSRTELGRDQQFQQLVPLIRKTLRIFLVVVAVMVIAQSVFDQNIGAWLAGLGIAGLAVSLAAQDSLKNLFGSITIIFDRPFQVGERIVYGGYDGIVEEIGFRSTKVRTLTGHLVTIPNANIVNDPVENIGRRKSIRRLMNVTITYDTPREKIEQAVQILRDILEEEGLREPIHATIDGDEFPPRVYFSDYNSESLNILVIYWYAPATYWDYMDHAQRLNLRIFEEYDKAGIEFAFPTQTLYLAGDPKRELVVKMLGKDLAE